MYSVLLAVALTTGTAETPNFCFRGCHCSCSCSCSCSWGCHGCHGCHGCYNAFSGCGGCYGCSCYGCACYGCCACYGGCSCSSMCASWSCACSGCGCGWPHGYVATAPVYAPVYAAAPVVAAPVAVAQETSAAATVVVSLPAEATLFVDGDRVTMNTTTRTFKTPQLQAGRDYFYTMKAETVRNGEKVEKSTRVVVRAGETARADFGDLSDAVAVSREAPAKITVKLPSEAKLFVDDVACTLTSDERTFETPKLQSGKTYRYTLRAEMVREGRTVKAERKVVMSAGESVTVNFDDLAAVRTASR